MKKSRRTVPHVVIILEASIKACRDKLRGILNYSRLHGPWQLHLIEGRSDESRIGSFRRWGTTGIISETGIAGHTVKFVDEILEAKLPTVLLDPTEAFLQPDHPFSHFSTVTANAEAIGVMGAEYFIHRGLKNFAFIDAVHPFNWSCNRKLAFMERIRIEGLVDHCFIHETLSETEKNDLSLEQRHLVSWLRSLPKPVGIMAAMDTRGRQVLEACRMARINIPYEAQVLGVDNDEVICDTDETPLSSIMTDNERGGYLAAELLEKLMNRLIRKKHHLHYGPIKVVERRSTESIFLDDPLVIRAVEHIRINSGINIDIPKLARQLKISQRLLQMRTKQSLGITLMEEIQRVRFNYICALLIETDLSITEIVQRCGLENTSHLGAAFKKRFNKTMGEYRKQHVSGIQISTRKE